MTNCDHQWVFMETVRQEKDPGGYNLLWIRIDRFYCEKCLEFRDKKREEYSRDTPEWYR